MLFNSYIFILLFYPVFVIGYYLLNRVNNRKSVLIFMICMSLVFYGYNNVKYVPLIVCSIVVNYLISRLFVWGRLDENARARGIALLMGVMFNVGLIFYFKYYDFFFQNFNSVFHTDIAMKNLLLPLGISFFTFQQVSFLVDSYRKETADYGFLEYMAFVTFFPQLVAGPIVLHNELIPQFRDSSKGRIDWDNLADGLCRFCFGLLKKAVVADTFAAAVAWGFKNVDKTSSADLIIVMISYTFQIYFDFSGYSDMAVGLAQMVNLKLPINFNSPYKSYTIREFWKRWHMTLTRFLTSYVYIPLGGSKKGQIRTYLNMFIVFLISGIWHGANWTFILWGVLHGLLCIAERIFEKHISRVFPVVKWTVTFAMVNILWLLFRAESVEQWKDLLLRIVAFDNMNINAELLRVFDVPEREFIFRVLHLWNVNATVKGFPMLLFMLSAFIICLCFENNYYRKIRKNIFHAFVTIVIGGWALLSLAGDSVFLYFNF